MNSEFGEARSLIARATPARNARVIPNGDQMQCRNDAMQGCFVTLAQAGVQPFGAVGSGFRRNDGNGGSPHRRSAPSSIGKIAVRLPPASNVHHPPRREHHQPRAHLREGDVVRGVDGATVRLELRAVAGDEQTRGVGVAGIYGV